MTFLDMTVEEGIKMVISGGIVTPPDKHPERPPEIPCHPADPGDPEEETSRPVAACAGEAG